MGIENGVFNPEAERIIKVESIKKTLVEANFLRPDENQREQMSENLGKIFSEQLKHGTKSVIEMDQTMDDFKNNGSTTEIQSKNAEEDKKILGEAVVLAVRELRQDGKVLDGDIYRGSRHMENMLPIELKGLGREITKGFIGNDEIDKQLNLVEVTRQSVDLNNPASVETLIQKIDVRIKKLSDKDYDDEEDIGEQDTALTMLNTEKKNLDKIVNLLDRNDDVSEKKSNDNRDKNGKNREEKKDGNKTEASEDNYDDVRNEIKGLDFNNKEQILNYCRDLLDYLENSEYNVDDLAISGETTRLLNYITKYKIVNKEGFSEIIREVNARLSLHDSAFFMMEAGGGLSDKGPGILSALSKIGAHNRFLTRDKMKFFFDNKDYNFSEAWDLLQKATYDYKNFLREAGFTESELKEKFKKPITKDPFYPDKYTNYQYDSSEEDKFRVKQYILKRLGGGEKSRKALQLAQKMFEATGEISISNVGFINSDEYTEAIQFGRYREDDARFGKTKNAGPDVSRGWIKSLTPGWVRGFCAIKDPDEMVFSKDIKAHYRDIQEKKEFYAYHGSILVNKIAPLKILLMDKSIKKPEEVVDMDFIKSKVDLFNKADPDNEMKLKSLWIAGLLQSNMMHINHVWDADHVRRLKEILVKDNLMLKGANYESGQEKKYFLTEDEWKWVAKTINLKKYFIQDFAADVVGGMFKTRFKRK